MKSTFFFLSLCFLAVSVRAQSKWSYAVYSSAGASHIHFSKILHGNPTDTKMPPFRAWKAGAFAQYHWNAHWSMRYGAAWQLASDRQNALLDYGPIGSDQASTQRYRHQDLLFPAEIVLNRVRSRRGFHIAGQLTPVLSLQRRVEETTSDGDPPFGTTADITGQIGYHRADLYIGCSLGWEFPLHGKQRLLLEAFFTGNSPGNLLSLGEERGWPVFTNPTVRVFGISAGIELGR